MKTSPLYAAASTALIILPGSASLLFVREDTTLQYDFTNRAKRWTGNLVTQACEDKATPQDTQLTENSTCASLVVPLDYSDASAGNTTLAIIKKPSQAEPPGHS
ncbi:hypothetical protein Ptr902_00748 [Pyrenophora tritici-repentis]|nr:hypothetical protein Ptr902_00748 [Pyrenophora tritici-repentis]